MIRFAALSLLVLALYVNPAHAQMPRERADPGGPVDELFLSTQIISMASVSNVARGNLDFTIMHAFGRVSDGVDDLFGLDGAANIRFGLDYGVTDRLSVGVGRSRFDKVYDARVKANLLRQTKDDAMPVEVAFKGDAAVTTNRNGYDLVDRMSYMASVMVARRFSDRLSVQVAPMLAHFNTVALERDADGMLIPQENTHAAIAIAGRWAVTDRVNLLAEVVPVLGSRSSGTADAMAVGIDIETGGHVFQMFFAASAWMTEQHTIARSTDEFLAGDFRWGFNIHRVFAF